MKINKLKQIVIHALEALKAQDIITLDVGAYCDFTDIMIICSGTSNRHVKSIADNLVTEIKKHKIHPLGIEGENEANWILVDLGEIVVHVMQMQTREFYQLEQLWGMQPE